MNKLTEIQMSLRANMLGKKHWEIDPNRTNDEQVLTVDRLLEEHTQAILAWVDEVIDAEIPQGTDETCAKLLRIVQRKRARQ